MSFIRTIPEEAAEGLLQELYQAARKANGYLPNYAQAFSLRPQVYEAWTKLSLAIRSNLKLRRYELVTLTAARVYGCSY